MRSRPRRRRERVRDVEIFILARRAAEGAGAPRRVHSFIHSFVRSFVHLSPSQTARVDHRAPSSCVQTHSFYNNNNHPSFAVAARALASRVRGVHPHPASGLVPVFVVYANPNANPPVSAIFPNRSWFLSSAVSSPIARSLRRAPRRRGVQSAFARARARPRRRASGFASSRRRVVFASHTVESSSPSASVVVCGVHGVDRRRESPSARGASMDAARGRSSRRTACAYGWDIIRIFGHSDIRGRSDTHGGSGVPLVPFISVIRGIIVPRRSYENGACTHIPETRRATPIGFGDARGTGFRGFANTKASPPHRATLDDARRRERRRRARRACAHRTTRDRAMRRGRRNRRRCWADATTIGTRDDDARATTTTRETREARARARARDCG